MVVAHLRTWFVIAILVAQTAIAQDAVEFNRDVRPILADACFRCHGPDSAARQADLRLDDEAAAKAKREHGTAIVPGQLANSQLWQRITSTDADDRMPPADSGTRLSDRQIATLRHWIEQGAKWQRHWAFIPPTQPVPPASHCPSRMLGPIDAFIHARLTQEGLDPAPPAEEHTLLRRVTLDLTGLPPTPDEIAAFLADRSPDAYERVVDRLLASPRYGERMAVRWLDAARYADTHGYQSDGERHMWRWRDWVIEAFNANQPFDQFTIEQLAGDLLPQATLAQRIATGFNRNHRGNGEGGIIPEEYAVEYVVDRVETTSTVWLGLTMGCVRCHDHKFDPFKQADFYKLFALFNNVPEKGRAVKTGNSPPYITAPTRLQAAEWDRLRQAADAADLAWSQGRAAAQDLFEKWVEEYHPTGAERDALPIRGLVAQFDFDEQDKAFEGERVIDGGDVGDFGLFDPFTISAWVWIGAGGGGTIVSRMTDVPEGDGYHLAIVEGKLQFNLIKRWLDDALRVESQQAIEPGRWHHVAASFGGFRGERLEDAVRLYVDGQASKHRVLLAELNQPFKVKEPLRIGGGGGPEVRFRGRIDKVRLFASEVEPTAVKLLAVGQSTAELVPLVRAGRTSPAGVAKLISFFMTHHAPAELREKRERFEQARRALHEFENQLPTVMVMEEMNPPRTTHILKRGQYDQPGDEVQPDVLTSLLPPTADLPKDRLGLARWLADPRHPLTSRVTVNRYWQMYFGTGLVKTAEDFGTQGQWPLHPELLDWLATDFIQSGWDVKAMQRRIVTSHAYRQSSHVTAALASRDPENRLLARGPRLACLLSKLAARQSSRPSRRACGAN
jgi:mono/diheme cytochrome c family protein